LIAVEVENRSAAGFAVAFVVRPSGRKKCRVIDMRDAMVFVDDCPAIAFPRVPRAWAAARAGLGSLHRIVTGGETDEGAFGRIADRRGVEAAFVFPVPHRTSVRAIVLLDARGDGSEVDPSSVPAAEVVSRGWKSHLERGMRAELPDEALQRAVDASRAALLLDASTRKNADVLAALEDWGFDDEATRAWIQMGSHGRRAASRRAAAAGDPWTRVAAHLAAASPAIAFPGGPARFLRAVRDLIVREHDGAIDLMPGFPPEWLGRDLAVHGAPTRSGPVSFAVRWHGERPALLWDSPEGSTLTAQRLDPAWSAPGGAGETLLARPQASPEQGARARVEDCAPKTPG